MSAREWEALLRALQQLGWSALDQCRTVWKVFCRLRAGIDADVAAKAKTVATRARQQRWRDLQTERETKRAAKREKAAADKERAHRLRAPLEASRPDRPPGWTARIPDRAVLHWGAMRNFITLLSGNSLRVAALANVTATARHILSRAQKKHKRRLLQAKSGKAAGQPDTQARATARVRLGWGRGVKVGPLHPEATA